MTVAWVCLLLVCAQALRDRMANDLFLRIAEPGEEEIAETQLDEFLQTEGITACNSEVMVDSAIDRAEFAQALFSDQPDWRALRLATDKVWTKAAGW